MKKLLLLCTTAAIGMPTAAFAQSTGSVDFEKEVIVVTGARTKQVGGVEAPDTPKAKVVLGQEIISRSNPGQTILDTVNVVPGVSFQNNDAYGSSGGSLTIRGFSSDRISLTFDGIQLNDSGNYAIFSNQQLDPELIDQVNVNLGSTDVDSPTASAVGGTVNYRTRLPGKEFGGRFAVSAGEWDFSRLFGMIDTGEIGPFGTRAFIAGSRANNDLPYNGYGRIRKKQVNARIYQPMGSGGDFLSIAGHYNTNKNNSNAGLPLRVDLTRTATIGGVSQIIPRIVGSNAQNRFPTNRGERFFNINEPCAVDTAQVGVADAPAPSSGPNSTPDVNGDFASCGTEFDRRYNPSNTGNIRVGSRFTLAPGIVLTVDPSYQYVKANGGGTVTAEEGLRDINPAGGTASVATCRTTPNSATNTCVAGYLGGTPYFGRDINGDADTLDRVNVIAPSQTQTHRYGVIAGLRWDINDNHTVRVSYTLDHARHRQTGQVAQLLGNGEPINVFAVDRAEADVLGVELQKRDRKSLAILNQIAGEYRGEFGALTLNLGVRAPYFKRDLNNYCFTSSAGGFVECFGQDASRNATFATLNPTLQGPQHRVLKYHKLLPNLGAVYHFTPQVSGFASYAKGLSVPSTDNLYNAFFFAPDTPQAKPKPETTDTFDGGVRFRSSKVQAQLSAWHTLFNDRLASAYDPELNVAVFRNLGRVTKYGVDASVSFSPVRAATLYAFGSYNKSKIKDNIQVAGGTAFDCNTSTAPAFTLLRNCAFTAGNRESGAPKYTYGVSGVGRIADFELGLTAKRTGERFVFDTNTPVFAGDVDLTGAAGPTQIYGATAPAYWLVNLDARYNLRALGSGFSRTYLQLNVYNLFDKLYVGGFGGGLSQTVNATTGVYGNPSFVPMGAPRTVSGTLNFEF